ncbi:23S rRNA (pseudouridine(1915)-N(3))-methyltransferase RlmH [Cryptobacterium curtum]|uniref:23S rRNA (pseudouridine(1915)-N(3))-methyltransferase RlmH n=1 Tax=Cryptobacterium curtum TaxID=84163 RepID=UPI00248EE889|nr:23S rRNA (pseudouridine(1915)-N(3))-methyltransferase RlmH [Cryptobacterium curtum]
MLKITVIAPGKLKEQFWRNACAEYQKRLGSYVNLCVRELPDSTPEKEGNAILAVIESLSGEVYTILLDIEGVPHSSEDIATQLDKLAVHGISHVAFIIGGSEGVSNCVRTAANERISFGPITLPHNLARVVLFEQLYRACKILRHEPYHK